MNFITPVEITPVTEDSWEDVNVSAYIPAGATGVVLHCVNKTSNVDHPIGFRKNGSGDDRHWQMERGSHFWAAIGVDGSRILELYSGDVDVDIWLVGYFTDDAVFFTNGIGKTPGSAWADIDISSDTEDDTAIGAIFEVGGSDYSWAFRKNGSSDDRYKGNSWHAGAIIGVDGSEICEGRKGSAILYFFLVGYIISDATFNTNATDLSLGTINSWLDLSTLPAGAIGGFIEVYPTETIGYYYSLRKEGSEEEIWRKVFWHSWGIVEAASRIIEGKINNTNLDFFLVGYPTTAGPTTEKIEKTLKYCVLKTPSAKTKSLKYDVFLGATNIQKSLQYSIEIGLPTVTTQAVDNIEETTAMGHGTIVS